MPVKFANNFETTLTAGILSGTLTLPIADGSPLTGLIGSGNTMDLTLENGTDIEIVEATAQPSTNSLTIVRAQDGTTALAFPLGTRVSNRLTRERAQAMQVVVESGASVTVRKNSGADVGSRPRVNFIEGTNVTLTVADDAGDNEVDVTINASGGGGGGPTYTLYDVADITAASGAVNHTLTADIEIEIRADTDQDIDFRFRMPASPSGVYRFRIVFQPQFGIGSATFGFDTTTPSSLTNNLFFNMPSSVNFPDSVGWTSGPIVYEGVVYVDAGNLGGHVERRSYS